MTIDELANNYVKKRIEFCKNNGLEPLDSWFYKSIYKQGAKDVIKELNAFIQQHIHSALCTSPIILDHVMGKIKEILEEE